MAAIVVFEVVSAWKPRQEWACQFCRVKTVPRNFRWKQPYSARNWMWNGHRIHVPRPKDAVWTYPYRDLPWWSASLEYGIYWRLKQSTHYILISISLFVAKTDLMAAHRASLLLRRHLCSYMIHCGCSGTLVRGGRTLCAVASTPSTCSTGLSPYPILFKGAVWGYKNMAAMKWGHGCFLN